MTALDQFLQYRALAFKFSFAGPTLGQVEELMDAGTITVTDDNGATHKTSLDEVLPVRNVCAKLPLELAQRLDKTLELLDVKKRDFIEMVLIEALDRADVVLQQVDAFEFAREQQKVQEQLQEHLEGK